MNKTPTKRMRILLSLQNCKMLKIKPIALYFSILLLFCFCTKTEVKYVVNSTDALNLSKLFNPKEVYFFGIDLEISGPKGITNNKLSERFEKKGDSLASFDIQKAVYFYKRALSLNPEEKLYIKLGEYCKNNQLYKEAYNCFFLLTEKYCFYEPGQPGDCKYVFSSPTPELLFQRFLTYYLSVKSHYRQYDALEYLENDSTGALKKLLADSQIKNLPEVYNELKNFETYLTLNRDTIQRFNILCSILKDSSSTIKVTEKEVIDFRYKNDFNEGPDYDIERAYLYRNFFSDYNEMERHPKISFKSKLNINDSVIAIVYKVDTSEVACPSSFRHIYHRIATFTKNGIKIDNKILGLHSGDSLVTYSIENRVINLTSFKRFWKKPYVKKDFDNLFLKNEMKGQKIYIIGEDGKIVEKTKDEI